MTVETLYDMAQVCKKLEIMGYDLNKIIMEWKGGGIWEFHYDGKLVCSYDENSEHKNVTFM